MTQTDFIPGLELNEGFYNDIVKPLINEFRPGLNYAASLIGYGSDVLGFDTAVSMDHNWGPRLQIFLSDKDFSRFGGALVNFFSYNLPFEYRGFSVNFTDPRIDGTQTMKKVDTFPVNHLVEVTTLGKYVNWYLHIDNYRKIKPKDWLTFQDQNLIELTAGKVFHDGLGELLPLRRRLLTFYPEDIRLLKMAALWKCVASEEPFVGRCRDLGDFPGIKTISSRLTDLLIKITFYLEKRYIPYSKWRGSFFKTLSAYKLLNPLIDAVLRENDPERIERHLVELTFAVVNLHNAEGTLPQAGNDIKNFYGRPYKVVMAESIVDTLMSAVSDPKLKKTPLDLIGLDLKVDGADFSDTDMIRKISV